MDFIELNAIKISLVFQNRSKKKIYLKILNRNLNVIIPMFRPHDLHLIRFKHFFLKFD